MNISEQFDNEENFKRLGRRGPNFKLMCEHAARRPNSYVIETGTAWDKDNWEGQGQSTRVWAWLGYQAGSLSIHSIDIRPEASEYAKPYCPHVNFHIGESLKVLNQIPDTFIENTSVLYLDSMDWTAELNLQSAMHHLAELCCVWRRLPDGCLIVVDDRHGNGQGKHWLVEAYFDAIGLKPLFKNCQIGWVKGASN